MTWHEAIDDLEAQVAKWVPKDVQVTPQPWYEDTKVNVLVLERKDGRRATLEPASWKMDEVPTAVDLYSARGPRVRLQGPDATGLWRVLSSDLLPLRVKWTAQGFKGLIQDLLDA